MGAHAQTCADGGTGPCDFGCGQTQTCIAGSCCDNSQYLGDSSWRDDNGWTTATDDSWTTAYWDHCSHLRPAVVTTAGACVDKLNPTTGVSDCPNRVSLCNNAQYYSLMTDQCPRTCGRCTGTVTSAPTTCVDKLNPTTGVSDCPSRVSLCNNAQYYSLMTDQCPRTCGRCTATVTSAPTTCVDKLNPTTGVSDCPSRASLCNNSQYYSLMTDQCPRTCGRCTTSSVTTSTTTCADLLNPTTGVSDCPSRANLCNNAQYYSLMTTQCPRTCGRCTVGK